MNAEKQRIAIAEWCGWKWYCKNSFGADVWHHPDGGVAGLKKEYVDHVLPDYLNDLNAMHEAEKQLLTGDGWKERLAKYSSKLMSVMQDTDFGRIAVAFKGDMVHLRYFTLHATAAQRAEALLRTIGKWKNSEIKGGQP